MPYESQAQERWAHTKEGMKALGGKKKVGEWDRASKGLKLPARMSDMMKTPTVKRKDK